MAGDAMDRRSLSFKAFCTDHLESIGEHCLVELPMPAPGQLRLKIRACGVSYVDGLVALGR